MDLFIDKALEWGPVWFWLATILLLYIHAVHV